MNETSCKMTAAQRQGANVAHENFCRMRVVPEESNAGADHGPAENGQFGDLRHLLQFQVFGKDGVSAEICEDGERAGGNDRAANGQSVKPVCEIYGIAGANQHQHYKEHKWCEGERPQMRIMAEAVNHQVWPELLGKRDHKMRGVLARGGESDQSNGDASGDQEL